jgi:hypothetical protein
LVPTTDVKINLTLPMLGVASAFIENCSLETKIVVLKLSHSNLYRGRLKLGPQQGLGY